MKALNRNYTLVLLLFCSFFLQTNFGLAQNSDSLSRVSANKLLLESEVDTASILHADSLAVVISDSISLNNESNRSTKYSMVSGRSAEGYFGLKKRKGIRAWNYNSTFNLYNEQPIDTLLWLNHLNYPQQKNIETYTYLGTIGSPTQNDHFFSREISSPFLFNNAYSTYFTRSNEYSLYKTNTPFTLVSFSSAGSRREAEEMLSAFHSQNANDYLNFGIEYKFIGAKGVYKNQQTRSNNFAIFGNYCRGNFFVSSNFIYSTFKNKENGGIVNHSSIEDEVIEPALVPIFLNESTNSYSESKYRGVTSTLGYSLVNFSRKELNEAGKDTLVFTPLISTLLHYNYEIYSRLYQYKHEATDPDFYSNYYINPGSTRDSVSLYSHNFLAEVQFNQPFRYVGTPGLKAFAGINYLNYYSFKPTDFLYQSNGSQYNTSHIGVTAFSSSAYLSYRAMVRAFLSGHRANDKELLGEITLSPWKRQGMPTVVGNIMIAENEPDVFIKDYFSNHYKWENDFGKERRFLMSGKLKVDRLLTELAYNVLYINNYIYFDASSLPAQQANIAITSASVQNTLKIKGFNAVSKVVWQVNTNKSALSLPRIIAFSSIFYETVLVQNALTAQFGVSAFYRTKFYADAYNPAIGQFYLQRDKLIGNYPLVDVFVNLKWKKAIIFLKYEHVNQGVPNNEYFATYRYPMNPRVFKFGISWMFYD
jgi:hypothetical protein